MAMNPKLLRPKASGVFTPKSISGLALWLDAADSSTLFQNSDGTVPATASSDPVGYWGDKSGNGRHATQVTAVNRPTVGSSSTAGKNAVRNSGTGSVALQVAAWPYAAGNTQFAVLNASNINQGIYQRGSLNNEPRMAIQTAPSGVPSVRATRGGTYFTQTNSEVGCALSQWAIGATLFNTSLGRAYRDGAYGPDTTDPQTFSGDQELRLLSLPGNIYGINGGIAEFIYYDRQLTAIEVASVARYLSIRWGIALAPTVSNADAQDWVNRVYVNGGTVSTATANAANTFCNGIDAAGIRDRFYRLNLFCGGNLSSALVPLYRGPTPSGTQYGNATDTNANFVSGDYVETGASGGITGNGTTKYLQTGFPGNTLAVGNRHLSAYESLRDTGSYKPMLGTQDDGGGTYFFTLTNGSPGTTVFASFGGQAASAGHTVGGQWIATDPTSLSLVLYKNGTARTTSSNTTSALPSAQGILVFAVNGTPGGLFVSGVRAGRLNSYSIGLGFSATQASDYYSAMQAFQTALARNV